MRHHKFREWSWRVELVIGTTNMQLEYMINMKKERKPPPHPVTPNFFMTDLAILVSGPQANACKATLLLEIFEPEVWVQVHRFAQMAKADVRLMMMANLRCPPGFR